MLFRSDTMRSYMSQALFNEIMPTLDLPKDDLEAFASAIFERFSNPFNRHLLLSIALNSQSKFRAGRAREQPHHHQQGG